jgi:thioredoxin reductase (NADPH)
MSKIYDIAVIGGGSAGVMAVNRCVLNNDETLFFPGTGKDKKKSRALWVSKVENVPGHLHYKKGIEEPNREMLLWLEQGEFSQRLHWKKNRGITTMTKNEKGLFTLTDSKEEQYLARHVILCTGVMDTQPLINGSIEPVFPFANAQLLDYCLRCDGHHVLNKKTGVIGHGDGAAWVAVMLYERYQTPMMTIFTHGQAPNFSEDVQKLLKLYDIRVEQGEIVGFQGDTKEPRLEALILKNGNTVECDMAFISLGMIVYNELALSCNANVDARGFVTTDLKGESSVPNLFVAGDLRAGIKKQIYSAWDSAVDSADEINRRIRQLRREKKMGSH